MLSEVENARLRATRAVWLRGEVTDLTANEVIAKLLFLQFESAEAETRLLIDSPGGSVTAALAVYDTMQFVRTPIATYAVGEASGVAAMLLAAGTPGRRWLCGGARVTLGTVWSASGGETREVERLRGVLYSIYAHHTGRSREEIEAAHRGQWLGPEAARAVGLVDGLVDAPPRGA
jgi:ATP-dependent Clp protease, protease subunit